MRSTPGRRSRGPNSAAARSTPRWRSSASWGFCLRLRRAGLRSSRSTRAPKGSEPNATTTTPALPPPRRCRRQTPRLSSPAAPTGCSRSSTEHFWSHPARPRRDQPNQSRTPATGPTSTSPTPSRLETSAGSRAPTPSPSSRPAIASTEGSRFQRCSSAVLSAGTGWKVTKPPPTPHRRPVVVV
jgi:hypothetical protein